VQLLAISTSCVKKNTWLSKNRSKHLTPDGLGVIYEDSMDSQCGNNHGGDSVARIGVRPKNFDFRQQSGNVGVDGQHHPDGLDRRQLLRHGRRGTIAGSYLTGI
jgi:hypothetical protein